MPEAYQSHLRISRLNRREWIETGSGSSRALPPPRISRLNRREWIETALYTSVAANSLASPGLTAGSGLKLQPRRILPSLAGHLPA